MTDHRFQTGGLLRTAVVALHALVLLAAVAVPGYAIVDAVGALLDPVGSESLGALVDVRRWLLLLANTGVVCAVAATTAGMVGGLLGFLATRTDMPGRRVLLGAALFGACVPVHVSLVFVFSRIPLISLTGSALACGLLYGLVYTPLATLVLGATFRSSDRELEDQALLDAGPWQVLLRVTLPLARWGLVVFGAIVILLVATDSAISDLLGVRTFAEEIRSQYALHGRRAGPLLTAIPVLIVLALLLVTVQVRYRVFGEHSPWQFGTPARIFALGRWRLAAGATCGLAVAVGLGVPTLALVRHIGAVQGLGAAIWGVQRELLTSAVLAAAGATLVVPPAVGLAWSAARGGRVRWATAATLVLLLAVPAPVVGISLITLLNRPGLWGRVYDSPLIILIGYLVRFLPFAVLLLIPSVQRVPRELERAARINGCDWLGEHRHVRWPALLADAAVVWLVIVILCFGEVGATLLLVPPAWPTASVRAFTLLHFGVYRDLAVLALLSVGFILLPWGLLVWLLRRTPRETR